MPGTTGSRTPSAPDRGVCAISPSDLVGYTGNALTRIKELEQRVAELESKIVQTSQLSNISQQIGWVTLPSYLGIEGWTQTSYGTLIPPAGFYLGDIIPGYSGGLVDANGNVVWGLGSDGTLSGTAVLQIDMYNSADQITYSTTPSTVRPFANLVSLDLDGVATVAASGKINFNTTGFYMLSYIIALAYPSAAGSDRIFHHGFGDSSGWYANVSATDEVTGQSGQYYLTRTIPVRIANTTTDYVYLQVADNGTASGTRTCDLNMLTIARMKGL